MSVVVIVTHSLMFTGPSDKSSHLTPVVTSTAPANVTTGHVTTSHGYVTKAPGHVTTTPSHIATSLYRSPGNFIIGGEDCLVRGRGMVPYNSCLCYNCR